MPDGSAGATPVFTIKLYKRDSATVLSTASRVEIARFDNASLILTLFDATGARLEEHRIGGEIYSWAVIENPAGRTTEVIRPRGRIAEGERQPG
jgi:hypothetical protein